MEQSRQKLISTIDTLLEVAACFSERTWENEAYSNARVAVRASMTKLKDMRGVGTMARSITATKEKNPDGTYDVVDPGTFTLSSDQVIEWRANYLETDSSSAGNDFYIHRPGQLLNEIPLSTNLTYGLNTGTHFLNAGTYQISITYMMMGKGSYTIIYDRTASVTILPSSHNFGTILEGESPSKTFTISSTGDVPVTITSITSSHPHFEILSAPTNQQVPPNRTFQVRCNASSSPGTYSATITISGTSEVGATSGTMTVSCNVQAREPDISCVGSPNIGSADWFIGEVKTLYREFQNTGTEDLTLTEITVENDTQANVFTLEGDPDLTPVPQGATRSVAIRFAPPMDGGEATYTGHLVISSNDPDEPVKDCFFQAIAHHPLPKMRLESPILDYREVELGFAFTKAIIIHNDGDAPLEVSVNIHPDFTDNPNLEHYSLREGFATVNHGAAPAIFQQVYEPQATGGPHEILMRVSGNDPLAPSQDITLTGRGIPPIPIDNVLVLDRSGSMVESAGARRKIDALQTAADLYVHLLRPEIPGTSTGDKIGFVRYNDENDIYLNLDFVDMVAGDPSSPGPHLQEAEQKLGSQTGVIPDGLTPDGTTWIGGAVQTGAGMLVGSPSERKHVMVVLTDGKENVRPSVDQVLGPVTTADPALKMYSVGVGEDFNPDTLQRIAIIGNGYHQATDDLSGTSIFDLENFYFKIFSNATEMNLVVDPTYPVRLIDTNPIIVDRARIISSDRSVTFLVLEDPTLRGYYNLELIDPNGRVIVLGSTVGGIPVHRLQRHNYTLYRIVFPAVEQAPAYVGDWVLRLTPKGEGNPNPGRRALASVKPIKLGLVPIGFAAAVASNYRLAIQVLPSSNQTGADVTLTASLSDRGWPAVNGRVEVDVTTPSGIEHKGIQLYDDGTHGDAVAGDGTWTNHFLQTGESGTYKFFFRALGENERGELAPRQATRYLTLMHPVGPERVEEPCLPCWLQRLLWAVAILLLFLILLVLTRR